MKSALKSSARILLPAALVAMLLVGSSCHKEVETRFGFDSQFDRDSRSLTIMNVNKSADMVKLEGEINVNEGEVLVELIDPVGLSVFSTKISAPEKLTISRSYGSVAGNWKLKYQSLEGTGTIHLHMNTCY